MIVICDICNREMVADEPVDDETLIVCNNCAANKEDEYVPEPQLQKVS
jgi:hypothetical protein